jgi:hypothetical protein
MNAAAIKKAIDFPFIFIIFYLPKIFWQKRYMFLPNSAL